MDVLVIAVSALIASGGQRRPSGLFGLTTTTASNVSRLRSRKGMALQHNS